MAFTLNGTVITQTGTDTNLSGLIGVAGVTTEVRLGKTFYVLNSTTGLRVDGTLSWDNENECLIVTRLSTTNSQNFNVSATGVCVIGKQKGVTVDGTPYYGEGVGLILSSNSVNFFTTRHPVSGSLTFNGGEFHYGSILGVTEGSGGSIVANSTILRKIQTTNVESNVLRNDDVPSAVQFNDVRLQSTTDTPIFLFSRNGLTTFSGSFENCSIQTRTGVHTGALQLSGVSFAKNTAPQDLVFNGTGLADQNQALEITNIDVGSAIREIQFNGDRIGHLAIRQDVTLNVVDSSFNPLADVKLYLKTTDGGNRVNSARGDALTRFQNFIDYATLGLPGGATDLYEATSNGSGIFPALSVLTSRIWADSASLIKTDLYSKSQTRGNDNFDFILYKYGFNISTTEIVLSSSKSIQQRLILTDDLSITLTKSEVDSLPITITLEGDKLAITGNNTTLQSISASNLYDAVSAFMEDNFEGADIRLSRVENTINAVSNDINIELNYITFDGSITLNNTRQVTLNNGSTVSGGIIDSNGDSFVTFDAIQSWTVYPTANDRDNNTNPIDSGNGTFRFTFTGSATLYARVVKDSVVFLVEFPVNNSGETIYSLSSEALLSTLPSLKDIEQSTVLAKEASTEALNTLIQAIPTTDSVADLTPVLDAINNLNNIDAVDIRTELQVELARIDTNISSVAYDDSVIFDLVDALPTLAEMEASQILTAIADVTGLSTHNVNEVVTALQNVSNDFKADLTPIVQNQQVINDGVKKSSLGIPHNTDI